VRHVAPAPILAQAEQHRIAAEGAEALVAEG
jgi:hypothetical protein